MEINGWQPDPFGAHEERLFKQGKPTPLVRDDGIGSYDEPPGTPMSTLSAPPSVQMPAAEAARHAAPPTATLTPASVARRPSAPTPTTHMTSGVADGVALLPFADRQPTAGTDPHNVIWRNERSLMRLVTILQGNVHFDASGIFRRSRRLLSWTDIGWIEVEDRLLKTKGSARQKRVSARRAGGPVLRHRYALFMMSPNNETVLRIDRVALPRVAGLMYCYLRRSQGIQLGVEMPPDHCGGCAESLTVGPETHTRDGLVGIYVVPTTNQSTGVQRTEIGSGLQAMASEMRRGPERGHVTFVDQAALCARCQDGLTDRVRLAAVSPPATPRVLALRQYDAELRAELHRHSPWTIGAAGGNSSHGPLFEPQVAVLVPAGTTASRPSLSWLTGVGGAFQITLPLPCRVSGIVAGKGRTDVEIVARGDRLLAPDGFDTPTLGEYQVPQTIGNAERAREYWIETRLPAGVYVIRRRSTEGGMVRRILASFKSKVELSVIESITATPIDGLRGYEQYEADFRAARRHAWRNGQWRIFAFLKMIGRLLLKLILALVSLIHRLIFGRKILSYGYNGRGVYRHVDQGFVLWRFWTELTDRQVARFFARHSHRRDPVLVRQAMESAVVILSNAERTEEASALRIQAKRRYPAAA